MIDRFPALNGNILDIGGGGEGIIGRIYGEQVLAIDKRQEELDEAPDCCEKVLMDARRLSFPDGHFSHVTFFYSLMFMDCETQKQAIGEAARVLRPGGSLCVWDAEIPSAFPEPFVVELDISVPGGVVHTTYGVASDIRDQTAHSIGDICAGFGLVARESHTQDGQFYLHIEKGT